MLDEFECVVSCHGDCHCNEISAFQLLFRVEKKDRWGIRQVDQNAVGNAPLNWGFAEFILVYEDETFSADMD